MAPNVSLSIPNQSLTIKGFRAAAVTSGIRNKTRLDLALITNR